MMNKTNSKKKTVIIFLIIVLIGAFFFSFYTVNSKFSPSRKIVHPYGQPFSYKNAELQVKGKEILDYSQFSSDKSVLNALGINPKNENSRDAKIIFITVEFYNSTDKPLQLDLTAFYLESGNFSTQFDLPLMLHYNQCGMTLKLNKNQRKILKMPATLEKIFFSGSEWPTIKDRKFSLVYSLYPNKNIAEIVAK